MCNNCKFRLYVKNFPIRCFCLIHIFPYSNWITLNYSEHSKKYGPEKLPFSHIFHTLTTSPKRQNLKLNSYFFKQEIPKVILLVFVIIGDLVLRNNFLWSLLLLSSLLLFYFVMTILPAKLYKIDLLSTGDSKNQNSQYLWQIMLHEFLDSEDIARW